MEKIKEKMIRYLQEKMAEEVYIEVSEYDQKTWELFRKSDEEELGEFRLDETGALNFFTIYEEVEYASQPLGMEEIREQAKAFIDMFCSEALHTLHFSCMIDWDETYKLIYDKKDEQLGLFLPNSGVEIDVAKDGRVQQFSSRVGECVVQYPTVLIPKETAKSIYIDNLEFELVIAQLDKEQYANGDDTYHSCYALIDYVMEVEPDGALQTIEEYGGFPEKYEAIEKRIVPESELHSIIGLNDQYAKITEVIEDEERVEWWSKEDVAIDSLNIEEFEGDVIKLGFNKTTGELLSVTNVESVQKGHTPLTEKEAKDRALQFLFACYPKANEQFIMQQSHPSHHFIVEEDEELACESEYVFYFQRIYQGVKVDSYLLAIQVGQLSGKIIRFSADTIGDILLTVEPVISLAEAKDILLEQLEMELTFGKHMEGDLPIYKVSYLPAFPNTSGHIRMIDAITGEAFHVETGIVEEG
ncbi:YcdB/YcdC domain-containing protein [Bacillus sp. FJAT-42315]|uniref:YcdB/YcdC domain-containing protein n=1 Tax=Bacillus sp. FJAT-42315 TaxID=2014077 RepID=UPI000C24B6B8|nr:YcdB/YcdC domain-containing protein [Bacillus sp. FJAT-42315]